MSYDIRPFRAEDAPALTELINHTIRLGGSTAYEHAFSVEDFLREFHHGSDALIAHVAWAGAIPAGFQSLSRLEGSEAPNLGVGTFTDRRTRYPGAGQALFPTTRAWAEAYGADYIRATIRADNFLGLRYYRGLGFRDHAIRPGVPLRDGTPMDRIETRYALAPRA